MIAEEETRNIDIKITEQSRISEFDQNNIVFGRQFSDHMLIADYVDGAWKNVRIEPYGKLPLSPATSALHYGQSVFEGMKALKNDQDEIILFRPEDNWKRINISAKRMCIPEISKDIFMGGLTRLLRLDKSWIPTVNGSSLYIRPFIFATDEYIGVKASNNYRFMIITCPVGSYYSDPVKVKIETEFVRSCEGAAGYAKAAGNYGAALYPAKLAQQQGYHQLIWTDAKDHRYIEESGTMNIMFVINDTLITPSISTTILDGITRKSVLTLAKDWGMKTEERRISIDEIIEAHLNGTLKDAFGAGTAATIAHIALIGYKGKDYQLPPVEQREFSNKVTRYLDDLKRGKLKDPHSWLYKINT